MFVVQIVISVDAFNVNYLDSCQTSVTHHHMGSPAMFIFKTLSTFFLI